MFRKILLVSLVLLVSSSVHSAAASGDVWIDVKTGAKKRREKQMRHTQREALAEAAEKERCEQRQKKKRLKGKKRKQVRRKNRFARDFFKEFDAYFVVTEQGEDLEQVNDILDRMCALIKRGVSISTINPATGKTMLRQAIDDSRLCLAEFFLRNGAAATQEDVVLLRERVRNDHQRPVRYSMAFMATVCSGFAQDEADRRRVVGPDLDEIECLHRQYLLLNPDIRDFRFGVSVSDSE
ncbi:hypothetical protein K2X40_00060 [Candidatus Babeliales bacterium]|nr:hypothetical protein [Candidatus Babeliales bacterium]